MLDDLKSHIKNKDLENVKKLIKEHPEVLDQKDENGSTGFLIIAYSGLSEVFNVAKGVKLTFTFHEAIICGKYEIINKTLHDDHNMANEYSADGFPPLALAAFFDQTMIAKLLLEKGAKPNLQANNPSKVNALHSAVAKQNFELCKLIIEYGVNVNATQMQNVTALHSAAHRGDLNLVRLLVENGADLNLNMDNGDTAISIADRDGHTEIKNYLLSKVVK